MSMCSDWCYNHLNRVGVDLPDKIVIDIVLQVTVTKLIELRDELYNARDGNNDP